jgi:hypothetical protein
MSEKLLDGVQRCAALDLGERPAVPKPIRVDALLDPGLRREPLAERAHVAVPERLALQRAEERMPTGEPESLPAVEPAVDGLGCVAGRRAAAIALRVPSQSAECALAKSAWSRGDRCCGASGVRASSSGPRSLDDRWLS